MLYKNRSFEEAAAFIDRLMEVNELASIKGLLDLACGRGRHAVHFHQKGYEVVGLDLSKNSIAFAKQFEKQGLRFETGDMRHFDLNQKFDAVFNLFTSFGYFQDISENKQVLFNVHKHLNSGGYFVIDYFNAHKVIADLVAHESKTIDGVAFEINKRITEQQIVKTIDILQAGDKLHFEERVQLIYPEDLISYLESSGFQVLYTFGNYELSSFNEQTSERFITIAKSI